MDSFGAVHVIQIVKAPEISRAQYFWLDHDAAQLRALTDWQFRFSSCPFNPSFDKPIGHVEIAAN